MATGFEVKSARRGGEYGGAGVNYDLMSRPVLRWTVSLVLVAPGAFNYVGWRASQATTACQDSAYGDFLNHMLFAAFSLGYRVGETNSGDKNVI